jgi:hypothetical protein
LVSFQAFKQKNLKSVSWIALTRTLLRAADRVFITVNPARASRLLGERVVTASWTLSLFIVFVLPLQGRNVAVVRRQAIKRFVNK